MSDKPKPCMHGRNFCLECHGVIEFEKSPTRTFVCTVFGCTIPRGIPHEHTADVSGLVEAAYRLDQDRVRNGLMSIYEFREAWWLASNAPQDVDPMFHGRKLRDSLLMAGNISRTESTSFNVPGGGSVTVDTTPRSSYSDWNEAPRLSVVKAVGYLAAGIVIGLGIVLIVVLSAMNAGVL